MMFELSLAESLFAVEIKQAEKEDTEEQKVKEELSSRLENFTVDKTTKN